MKKGGFAFVLLICLCLFACTNNTSSIGLDLLGNQIGTDFTDTITVEAFSVLEDTLNTSAATVNMIGSIRDPVFGDTKASTFAQFALSGSSVNFGSAPKIDSVVLALQISSCYGDSTSKVEINVYELTENLDSKTNYYQTSSVEKSPTRLNYGNSSFSINPTSQVIVDTGAYSAHLRIRLTQDFGQYLLDHQSDLNTNFENFLKGLCIEGASHSGSTGYIFSTNLTSALSGIVIYYHNDSLQNMRYQISCTNSCARFTKMDHDYASSQNSDFVEEVLNGNVDLGKKILFLQGGGGVKTKLTFPYLEKFGENSDDRIVIHRAELVISNVRPDEQYLIQPPGLTLQGISKSTGAVSFIPDDDYFTNSSYYGGIYDAAKKEYRFRITNYVQQLIQKKGDLSNSLYLVVRGAGIRPNRLLLDGTDYSSDSRLRLEIAYSKY